MNNPKTSLSGIAKARKRSAASRKFEEITRAVLAEKLRIAWRAHDYDQHALLELMLNHYQRPYKGIRTSRAKSSPLPNLLEGFEALAIGAVESAVYESLAQLTRLAQDGNGDACNLLLRVAAQLTETLNNEAIVHPDLFCEHARQMTAWPLLKSPSPAFSVPSEAKPRPVKSRLRPTRRESDFTYLMRELQVGKNNALTSRGEKGRAIVDDRLGKLARSILKEIEELRRRAPYFQIGYPKGSLEAKAATLPASQIGNAVKWAEVVKLWAKEKFDAERMTEKLGHLVHSRAHQDRKYSKLLDMLFEKTVSLLGGKVGAHQGRKPR